MHLVQTTAETPLPDRRRRHPELEQLGPSDHPMLRTDQGPSVSSGRVVDWCRHDRTNAPRTRFSPPATVEGTRSLRDLGDVPHP
jgi:hypothetical protein